MKRIDSTNKAVDLFGPGKHGFQGGNPSLNQPATFFTPEWANHIQEEIANVIEYFGTALDPDTRTQLIGILNAKFPKFNGDGTISSTADASLANHLTRLSQVQSLIGAIVNNTRAGHTYTMPDWCWLDKGQQLILQWLSFSSVGTYSFPTAFPNACLGVFPVSTVGAGIHVTLHAPSGSVTTSNFYLDSSNISNASGIALAIGR